MRWLGSIFVLGLFAVGFFQFAGDAEARRQITLPHKHLYQYQTLFNLIGQQARNLVISSDGVPVRISVEYLGSKSTTGGHNPAAPIFVGNVDLGKYKTQVISIDSMNPAFGGGYGAVRLTTVPCPNPGCPGAPGPFQAALLTQNASMEMHQVSGDQFNNHFYTVPVPRAQPNALRMKIAVINLGTLNNVNIFENKPGGFSTSVMVENQHVYLFDTQDFGLDLQPIRQFNVTSNSTIAVAVVYEIMGETVFFYPSGS